MQKHVPHLLQDFKNKIPPVDRTKVFYVLAVCQCHDDKLLEEEKKALDEAEKRKQEEEEEDAEDDADGADKDD